MKKRGNISLLVLFVLLTCSLLGLLTVHFLKNMSTQYNQILSYYKWYYLAQAGIETALTQLQHRGLGFSETIDSNNPLVAQNINQPLSSFSVEVRGSSNFLSTSLNDSGSCDSPFTLAPWKSLVLPLFVDAFSGTVTQSFVSPFANKNLGTTLALLKPVSKNLRWGPVNFGLLIADATGMYQNGIYFSSGFSWNESFFKDFGSSASRGLWALEDSRLQQWQTDSKFSPYFIIANKDSRDITFCLTLPQGSVLPTQQYLIQSFGLYWATKLWLEATYRQPLPSFLIDSSFAN